MTVDWIIIRLGYTWATLELTIYTLYKSYIIAKCVHFKCVKNRLYWRITINFIVNLDFNQKEIKNLHYQKICNKPYWPYARDNFVFLSLFSLSLSLFCLGGGRVACSVLSLELEYQTSWVFKSKLKYDVSGAWNIYTRHSLGTRLFHIWFVLCACA